MTPRDLRDPLKLGEALLKCREGLPREPLSYVYDLSFRAGTILDYVDPVDPRDRYGDPTLIQHPERVN